MGTVEPRPVPARDRGEGETFVSERPFLTVGIGASAGGVEALQKLFRNMPRDTGMAFLLMTHQARDKDSMLAEILQRDTEMPVILAQDGAAVAANTLHVCPPGHVVSLDNLTLRVS